MVNALDTDLEGNGGGAAILKWFSYTCTNVANGGGETCVPDCSEIVHAWWHGDSGVTISWTGKTVTLISTAGTEDGTLFILAR